MANCVIFCLLWAIISSSANIKGGVLATCPSAKTVSERCQFDSDLSCISASAIDSTHQLPKEGHFCERKNIFGEQKNNKNYMKCGTSCFNENSPIEFSGNEDPLASFCKSVPMPCKFPFTHNGETYDNNECLNSELLLTDENSTEGGAESNESFLWCATHLDNDGNMVWWGQCDLESCEEKDVNEQQTSSESAISAEVKISPDDFNGISGTINLKQASQDSPLIITGTVTGLPKGLHGLHVHESKLKGTDCNTAGAHFNPENAKHGSSISSERHAGDFGNINANEDGTAIIDMEIAVDSGSTLFGDDHKSILEKTLVIHQSEDDLGTKENDEESTKTGNAGKRIACAIIMLEEANQGEMMRIIIIVLIVIIVLLLILITALIIYCCKRKGQVSKGKGDDGAPFQNGDMKKKPLEYDELSIPFIDASPAPTPKVGRSTERLSFFNRTPSIGRSRGSLSNEDKATA